jgi:hypothetical protein
VTAVAFSWRDSPNANLLERFAEGTLGLGPWRRLVGKLEELGPEADPQAYLQVLEDLIDQTLNGLRAEPAVCRVFVSHQQKDSAYAERIAFLATQHRFDYWLDIHDPLLIRANQILPTNDPRYPIIIAAIIEIGLLNSTHVVAVHTQNSFASKWVPYELGRAKARQIRSDQAAGWFSPKVQPSNFGEYVLLAVIMHGGEKDLLSWLRSQSQSSHTKKCVPAPVHWNLPPPALLP